MNMLHFYIIKTNAPAEVIWIYKILFPVTSVSKTCFSYMMTNCRLSVFPGD